MAIASFTRTKHQGGRSGASDSLDEKWIARGTDITVTELLDRAESETPTVVDGLDRLRHSYNELGKNHF